MCVLAISQNRERRNEYALEKLSDVDSDISPPNNHTTNIYIPLLHDSPCKPEEIVTDFVKYTLSPGRNPSEINLASPDKKLLFWIMTNNPRTNYLLNLKSYSVVSF